MLREYFEEVLQGYKNLAGTRSLSGPIADKIKTRIPDTINRLANLNQNYLIEGSVGKGNLAEVPWVRVYEKEISPSAQEEYYIVYLFDSNMQGFYLSLNQGVTQYEELYGLSAESKMKKNTDKIKSLLPKNTFLLKKINLNAKNKLGKEYEVCHICGKFYQKENIPEDVILIKDLQGIVKVYEDLKKTIGNTVLNLDENYTPKEIKEIRNKNRKKSKSNLAIIEKLKQQIKMVETGLDQETDNEDYFGWKERLKELEGKS